MDSAKAAFLAKILREVKKDLPKKDSASKEEIEKPKQPPPYYLGGCI